MNHDQFVTQLALHVAQGRVDELDLKDRTKYYTALIAEWKAAYADFAKIEWDKTFPSLGTGEGPDDAAPASGGGGLGNP